MDISGIVALVTGAGSGLGKATAMALAEAGAKVAAIDFDQSAAHATAVAVGGHAFSCDVSNAHAASAAVQEAHDKMGPARILINCAGVAPVQKVLGRNGTMSLDDFRRGIEVNLIGTFNMLRLFAERASLLDPLETQERGVVVNTASIAAYEGQIGQTSYAASKAGVVGLTLPAAREFAPLGIRVCTIAPGIFETAMLKGLPPTAQESLGSAVPFPSRLGYPSEFASLALAILSNPMLNGETIRLDGALRMPPK